MADLDSIKRIYRRLAKIKAGDDLQIQVNWLQATFIKHAEHTDDDSSRVTTAAFKGQTSGFAFPDSTPQERADALDQVITELEAEIDGTVNSRRPGCIVANFVAPR